MSSEDQANKSLHFRLRETGHDLIRRCRCLRPSWSCASSFVLLTIGCMATFSTFVASWDCTIFAGTEIPWFIGGTYGIWALKDTDGTCQLWSVLFFAYKLDGPLIAARASTMIAMILSLAVMSILVQVVPFGRLANLAVAICLIGWLLDSISWLWRFNIWSTFFIFTYALFLLVAHLYFLRLASQEVVWRTMRTLFLACALTSSGSFFILASNVCTCDFLPEDTLENIGDFDRFDECSGQCTLGFNGGVAKSAPILWLVCWILAMVMRRKWTGSFCRNQKECVGTQETSADNTVSTRKLSEDPTDVPSIVSQEPDENSRESTADEIKELDSELQGDGNASALDIEEDAVHTVPAHDNDPVDETVDVLPCRKWVRRILRVILGLVVLLHAFLVFLLVAAYIEDKNAAQAPDTSHNFITDEVCAYHPLDASLPFATFSTKEEADEAGYEIAHCGACGRCSNPGDIKTYVDTRKTVAILAKKCSKEAIFGTYDELNRCLERKIGFTGECTECWADNMKNTAKYCKWTCLSSVLIGISQKGNNVKNADDYNWLNQCLYCDEKRSGPAFVACSGVARRRLGIQSAIERNPKEQCQNVDFDYVTSDLSTVFP